MFVNRWQQSLVLAVVSVIVGGCSSPYKYTPRTGAEVESNNRVESQSVYTSQSGQSATVETIGVSSVLTAKQVKGQSLTADLPEQGIPKKDSVQSGVSKTGVEPVKPKQSVVEVSPVKSVSTSQENVAVNQSVDGCHSTYVVQAGDALSNIAFRCRVEMEELAKANALKYPYSLSIGQVLTIPESLLPVATVRSSDNALKSKMGQEWRLPMKTNIPHKFITDAKGLAVLEFYGVSGDRINAVASGKVVYSGNGILNFGWMVVVKHPDDFMSVYAHNSSVLVKEGDEVDAGQFIAVLGATGQTTKPKLYLEARFKGRKVDIRQIFSQL